MTSAALPEPGSPAFVPALLSYIAQRDSLNGWKVDPTLFSTILLALIVDKGGVIVDVARDDGQRARKGLAQVVQNIVATTCTVFGLTTTYAHLTPDSTPESIPYHFIHQPHRSPVHPSISRNQSVQSYYTTASSPGIGFPQIPGYSGYSTPLSPRSGNVTSSMPTPISYETRSMHRGPEEFDPVIPDILVISGLEDTNSPATIKLVDILTKRYVDYEEGQGMRKVLPNGFMVIWIRETMGTDVPGWVVDQFAASTLIHPADLDRPPEGLLSQQEALIPPEYIANLASLLPYTHIHPPLQIHISNLLSALTSHSGLHCTMTARAHTLIPQFVRAHRLLSHPFALPVNWVEGLSRIKARSRGEGEDERFGVGGGRGGVNTWARRAGEEPSISELMIEDLGEDEILEEWYATPKNVEGVWKLCTRHRTRARKEKGGVTWLINGSAGDKAVKEVSERARRGEAERILEEIIQTV